MLKIKADKMAELEKFGFELIYGFNKKYYQFRIGSEFIEVEEDRQLNVGNIKSFPHALSEKILNKFYDLIKADLVAEV